MASVNRSDTQERYLHSMPCCQSCFESIRTSELFNYKRLFLLLLGLMILALMIMSYHLVQHDHEMSTDINDEGLPPKTANIDGLPLKTTNIDGLPPKTANIDGLPPKTFLHLIQTESCIPKSFLSLDVFGNELACDCSIIVLSFKSKCLVNPPPHVKYISSNASTTFTTGRSLLYTTAMSSPVDYLYYIFLDDDVILYTKDKTDTINPWRWFESVLKRTQPPLAAIDRGNEWHLIDKLQQRRLKQNCSLDPSLTYEFFPGVFFDAIANAFHGKAIRHILGPILPYWNKLDNASWWFSQWYVYMITDVTFHGQAVVLTRIMTKNDVHRPYGRKHQDTSDLQSIADDIRKVIPEKYAVVTDGLLKTWVANYTINPLLIAIQETYCKEPPAPNSSIVPFSWAEGI